MIHFDSANIANINEMHIMPDTYPVLRSSEGGSVRLRHLKQKSSEGSGQLPCRALQVSFGARLQSRAKVCTVCSHLWTSAYWAPEQMGMAIIDLEIRCCLSTLNGSELGRILITWLDLHVFLSSCRTCRLTQLYTIMGRTKHVQGQPILDSSVIFRYMAEFASLCSRGRGSAPRKKKISKPELLRQ
jgi:hypothetical protein